VLIVLVNDPVTSERTSFRYAASRWRMLDGTPIVALAVLTAQDVEHLVQTSSADEVGDALNELRRRAGSSLDDDSALLEMARQVLGGARDDGKASYQVALTVCPECNATQQQSAGGLVPIDADVARMAHCDAQHLGSVVPANDFTLHAHVGASTRKRARQSIPPAKRRSVLARDQRRCQVPGCSNATWLDVHHLQLRSEGGRHSLDNLVCVCSAHHRAAHRGELLLDRLPDGTLRARHADGSEYGADVNPHVVDLSAKVFSALRNMGFREAEARAALDRVRVTSDRSFTDYLKATLAKLHRARPDQAHVG
jgi:hypothetical protein